MKTREEHYQRYRNQVNNMIRELHEKIDETTILAFVNNALAVQSLIPVDQLTDADIRQRASLYVAQWPDYNAEGCKIKFKKAINTLKTLKQITREDLLLMAEYREKRGDLFLTDKSATVKARRMFNKAIHQLKQAYQQRTHDDHLHWSLARLYCKSNHVDRAIVAFDKLQNPTETMMIELMVLCTRQANQLSDAKQAITILDCVITRAVAMIPPDKTHVSMGHSFEKAFDHTCNSKLKFLELDKKQALMTKKHSDALKANGLFPPAKTPPLIPPGMVTKPMYTC